MSLVDRTRTYALEVAQTAIGAFERQARGNLAAPDGNENVRLYTAKGGSAVTLGSTTTTAVVVYDPEASVRNGQLNVIVYERDSLGTVVGQKSVTLGRSSDEFLSVGVLSSGLKTFNSSGVDVIGGTQTAAVLTSVPRDISILTSTDVSNSCANHSRDLVTGIVSRDDATMTMALTEHFGTKMCLSRTNTQGNIISRTWDDGIGSRRTTENETLSFAVDTTLSVSTSAASDTDILAAANSNRRVLDTGRLSNANNPLTLACYSASVDVQLVMGDPGSSATSGIEFEFRIYALDAFGGILGSNDVFEVHTVTDNKAYALKISGTVTSSTMPIHRVVVGLRRTSVQLDDAFVAAMSVMSVKGFEETADIAARPIHVCVFEGLNASATLNINTTAVLTGVPDSTNVFIGSATTNSAEVYDSNMVTTFLKSMTRALPRAFTISGHGAVVRELTSYFQDEEVTMAFKAMSFGKVIDATKRIYGVAKSTGKAMQQTLDDADRVGRGIARPLSMLPGPMGMAADVMIEGSDMYRSIRR